MKKNDNPFSAVDLSTLDERQTEKLCGEIREYLIDNVSRTGGHLASNLGAVELTVAVQKAFDTSTDRLVFDVGHQSYVHKLLTGRAGLFPTLRQFGGMAGFPKPSESVHDAFIAGHASNSVSVALGMARARTLMGEKYHVIALMGDGALTGGLAYEGLSDAGSSGEPLIVILNDNGMSITPNVGGMAKHLSNIRTRQSYYRIKKVWRSMTNGSEVGQFCYKNVHKLKERLKRRLIGSNTFNDMGFEYFGPIDGHDIQKMTYLFQQAKEMGKPVIVHVLTRKGKGYPPAEENPDLFHGIGKFDKTTGHLLSAPKKSFSDAFGEALVEIAGADPRVCAITAAMQNGTGLDAFAEQFPERFFDVGIAEGHAVSMAAGLAKQGMHPVVAIYSTFLQRAYDMIVHDVAILGLHVVFAVDRAGLVGNDGETHHGVFDIGFLRTIPGMQILCPASEAELAAMLRRALFDMSGPVAIRYPRGGDGSYRGICDDPVLRAGTDITLCAYGTMINEILQAADILQTEGISAEVVKIGQVKPLDKVCLASASRTGRLLIAESVAGCGSVFEAICAENRDQRIVLRGISLGDRFVTHGDTQRLYEESGISAEKIAEYARMMFAGGEHEA